MIRLTFKLVVAFAILTSGLLGLGCTAEVGDECSTNTDCGTELFCDSSMAGGYCTRTPCEPNECPEEAVCIRFDDNSTYCMRRCEADGDCRDGYVCVSNFGDAPFCSQVQYTEATTAP